MQLFKSLKSPVLLFWVKMYMHLMLFTSIFRVIECLYYYKLFLQSGVYELLHCFIIGILFDSSVIAVLLLLLFILSISFSSKKTLTYKALLSIYMLLLLFTVFNFIHIINFGVSFNYYSLAHIDSSVLKTIFTQPPFYVVLFGLPFCLLILRKAIPSFEMPVFQNAKKEILLVVLFLFGTSFTYLPFPFYYYCNISANGIINELPKNGLYCYVSSFQSSIGTSDLIEDVTEITKEDAANTVAKNYSNVTSITYNKIIRTVVPDSNYAKYKRVILIIMESMGSNAFNDSIAPNLFELKNQGLFFTKCKASGPRTQMAITTLMTGMPNVIGVNYYRRKSIYKIETLANYLSPLNYGCYYLHNGFLEYDNIDKLLLQGGFKNLIDANSINNYKQKNAWGVDDEALFIKAKEHIEKTSSQKSFYVLQSITNHEPFEIPKDFIANNKQIAHWNKKLQTYYYSDYMLGHFLKELKQRADYDSTLVFVTGDHGEAYNSNEFSYKVFHVPVIVLNGKIAPKTINYDCSHMDIPYTILSACGYNKTTNMLGENLFSMQPNRAIASTNYNNELNIKRHDTLYRYSFESQNDWLYKLNDDEMEGIEIKNSSKQKQIFKQQAFAHYKLVRDYLLTGKINR